MLIIWCVSAFRQGKPEKPRGDQAPTDRRFSAARVRRLRASGALKRWRSDPTLRRTKLDAWIARVVSQPEIGVGKPTAMETEKSLGRGAEPTFFWGQPGRSARARESRKARSTLDPHRCLARSHASAANREETGAIQDLPLTEGIEQMQLAADAAKKLCPPCAPLDAGPAIGCHRNASRQPPSSKRLCQACAARLRRKSPCRGWHAKNRAGPARRRAAARGGRKARHVPTTPSACRRG